MTDLPNFFVKEEPKYILNSPHKEVMGIGDLDS